MSLSKVTKFHPNGQKAKFNKHAKGLGMGISIWLEESKDCFIDFDGLPGIMCIRDTRRRKEATNACP